MPSYPVGQAPWEITKAPPKAGSFPVGSAPWEVKTAPAKEPGYFSRVGSEYTRIGTNLISELEKAGTRSAEAGGFRGGLELLRAPLRTVGAVAEAAFTPIVEAPIIKPLLEKVGETITKIPGVPELAKSAYELSEKNPALAKDLLDIVNIATLGGGSAIEKPLITEGRAIGRDVLEGSRALLTPSEEAIQKNVLTLFQKAIKPTAKKTANEADKYDTNVINALRTIKANSDSLNIEDATGELVTGRTPLSISELSQAVDQTKKTVFNTYDGLAKQAGTSGATIDAKPIAAEVAKVAENKALQLTNPTLIKYAEDWQERLTGFGVLDTETTQEVIKMMNANLQAFYRNPTYDAASKVTIDAGIANNFREALDKAIETATGEQYQILKRQYGALKAIENDVVRAAMREGRKNAKGLLDYTDMFTGGQMIAGLLSLNPAMFTKGAIERGFKEYIKYLNDPNRAIKNIFDKLDIDPSRTFTPQSETVKALLPK